MGAAADRGYHGRVVPAARATFLQLSAVARGDHFEATQRIRDAFSQASAWLTDVTFFSGVHTVFSFEVAVADLPALSRALSDARVVLDERSAEAVSSTASRGAMSDEARGTLAVTFVDGDPDLTRKVVAVPG